MHELILAFITNLSFNTMLVIVAPIACGTILVIVRNSYRMQNAVLHAQNTRREQEINQINHTLNSIANHRDQRITFLEGKLAERQEPNRPFGSGHSPGSD
jgi:hypothetical protein